jgi:hypothetical protein
MLQGNWVFDDREDLRPLNCWLPIRKTLPNPVLSGDLGNDLVRNLGFIVLCVRAGRVVLKLRTEVVSSVALSAAIYWLADERPERVMLVCSSNNRPAELIRGSGSAITRLVKLTKAGALNARCTSHPVDTSQLRANSHMQTLIDAWQATSSSRLGLKTLTNYANDQMDGRYGITSVTDGEHAFFEIGRTLAIPAEWRVNAIGRPLRRQPDVDYWNWVIGQQKQAIERQAPLVTRIRAKIFWPASGWSHTDYTRIILPLKSATDQQLCFVATSINAKTDTAAAPCSIAVS